MSETHAKVLEQHDFLECQRCQSLVPPIVWALQCRYKEKLIYFCPTCAHEFSYKLRVLRHEFCFDAGRLPSLPEDPKDWSRWQGIGEKMQAAVTGQGEED